MQVSRDPVQKANWSPRIAGAALVLLEVESRLEKVYVESHLEGSLRPVPAVDQKGRLSSNTDFLHVCSFSLTFPLDGGALG